MNPLIEEVLPLPMPLAAVRMLEGLGVPLAFVLALVGEGDLSIGQVELSQGGERFEFGGPDRRLILNVRDEAGELVDLVAMASHDESQWALRTGEGDLLGREWLEVAAARAAEDKRTELRLFATPMAWLREGGEGICVLDWTRTALAELRLLGPMVTLVCDRGAKAKLMGLLQFGGLPLVAEERAEVRAAPSPAGRQAQHERDLGRAA